ncbi:MAG: tryptophan--tRNA ligase [Planctomycetota bacterium]|jgi:tryptophanyl-tRNA synthetase
MSRIMSGIQPTGSLHIGNYLGALMNWVRLQEEYECFFSIVDLHALTARPDPEDLRRAVRELAIGVLASGVDPERAVLFVQSQVPEHTELAWVFSCMTQMGDLNRMTQFKDKSQFQPENINAGLFSYPVLQAADILIYLADRVPVGEDQEQHLELAREIVRRFNGIYGQTFPEPKVVTAKAPRVMGLDGETKMSKSRGNEIGLFEEADETMKKLRGAKTDPQRLRRQDPGRPELCNVFSYHGYFSDAATCEQVAADCRSASIGCVDCKQLLAGNLEEVKGPIRERAKELRSDPGAINEILNDGADRARAVARETMDLVRERVGF